MQKAPNFLKSLFTIVICYCSSRPAFIMLFALSIWASLIRIDWYWHCRICIIHYQSCFLFHCLKALTIEKAGSRKNKFFLFLNFINCIRLASLPFIFTSSCASLDTDAGIGVYQTLLLVTRWSYSYCDGPLTVWDLEDDSWIRFLKLLSEGHPEPLPDPEIWNIDIKRMCAEIKINGIIWIFFRLLPITNNHHPSSSINFVKHLLRLGVEGGFLEMASILNRSNPLTQMTLMTTLQTPQLILFLWTLFNLQYQISITYH